MKLSNQSIVWKQLYPLPILLGIVMLGVWLFLPNILADDVRRATVNNAVRTAKQFKILRGYYTKNVVAKVLKNGGIVSYNHKTDSKAIPLPATFIHDMSTLLKKENIAAFKLYSGFPFPNRQSRVLGTFERSAWDYLRANPGEVFWRQEKRDGKEILRVAIADLMTVKTCVDCHNTHPQSPKTDWKLGDVRGVLEVITNINPQLAEGKLLSNRMVLIVVIIAVFLIVSTTYTGRQITNPIVALTKTMNKLSQGVMSFEVPSRKRKDEIGDMARALVVFKQTAAELSDAKNELEQRVEVRTAELRAAQGKLVRKERLATLGQISATVSHELRNPLGTIRNSLVVLEKKLGGEDPEIQRSIERMVRNIGRCNRIVDEMLDFARARELELTKTGFDAWLGKILDELQVPPGVSMDRKLGAPKARLGIDDDRMRRVIVNIYNNACQAMIEEPEGKGPARKKKLTVSTKATNGRLELTFADTGPGMPSEVLNAAFEPLYSTKGFGVGLGLPIVKQIMEQHGGGIEITSKHGSGTRVVLWLPLEQSTTKTKRGAK